MTASPLCPSVATMCSTLDDLSEGLLRLDRYENEARIEVYMSSGDGMRLISGPSGGRHAANRPMETSVIVQRLGAERS